MKNEIKIIFLLINVSWIELFFFFKREFSIEEILIENHNLLDNIFVII